MDVEELEGKIDKCFALRNAIGELKEIVSTRTDELKKCQQEITDYLNEISKESYHGRAGVFAKKDKYSYRLPKDQANRELLFAYMKEQGVYDEMVGVNSITLNSWANQEIEAKGLIDYRIPGLAQADIYTVVSMRKA